MPKKTPPPPDRVRVISSLESGRALTPEEQKAGARDYRLDAVELALVVALHGMDGLQGREALFKKTLSGLPDLGNDYLTKRWIVILSVARKPIPDGFILKHANRALDLDDSVREEENKLRPMLNQYLKGKTSADAFIAEIKRIEGWRQYRDSINRKGHDAILRSILHLPNRRGRPARDIWIVLHILADRLGKLHGMSTRAVAKLLYPLYKRCAPFGMERYVDDTTPNANGNRTTGEEKFRVALYRV